VAIALEHRLARHLNRVESGGESALAQGLEFETQAFALAFASADMREGTTAFLEKRKPQFRGE
jgi:enoyl-CoA hydratase